jgi:hypothetical protein
MIGDFLTYIEAVMVAWFTGYWFLTAIPEALSYVVPSASAERVQVRLDQWVSVETRQSFYRALFIVGVFIAGFIAGDEQYQVAISKSPEALTAQLTSLQNEIAPLRTYKEQHEKTEYPTLTEDQQKLWITTLSPYSGKIAEIQIVVLDSRSELFVDSLTGVARGAHLPEPEVLHGNVSDGVAVASTSIDVATSLTTLLTALGYKLPPPKVAQIGVSEMFKTKYYLRIDLGRKVQ